MQASCGVAFRAMQGMAGKQASLYRGISRIRVDFDFPGQFLFQRAGGPHATPLAFAKVDDEFFPGGFLLQQQPEGSAPAVGGDFGQQGLFQGSRRGREKFPDQQRGCIMSSLD